MDMWISIGVSAFLQVMKDRKSFEKYRAQIIKVAAAILLATENDFSFKAEVERKAAEKR